MYRLGQSLSRPWAGYTYPKKKRRFLLTVRQQVIYITTLTDSVTVTDSIGLNRWMSYSIVHTATATDHLLGGQVYTKSITHNATASDSLSFTFYRPVIYVVTISHDVTAVQTIRPNVSKQFFLTDTATVTADLNQNPHIIHTVTVTDEIILKRVLYRQVTQNITATDDVFINSPRPLSIFHNVSVSDQFDARLATFRASISDTVTVFDFVDGRNSTFHFTVSHTATVTHQPRVIGAVYFISVSHSLTANQRINTTYNFSIVHDATAFHSFTRKKWITRTITTDLDLTSIFARDLTFTITTELEETSIWSRQIDVTRLIDTPLIESELFNAVLFIQNPGPHPVVSGVSIVYGYLTLLESQYGTIVLPVPELNDSFNHKDEIELKRSMSGILKAYIKKGRTTILKYTWLLDYPKALELKQWALTNLTEDITLTNWKGEIWYGKIINDDLILKTEAKFQGNARQQTSVTVQFEGIQING